MRFRIARQTPTRLFLTGVNPFWGITGLGTVNEIDEDGRTVPSYGERAIVGEAEYSESVTAALNCFQAVADRSRCSRIINVSTHTERLQL